MTLKPGRVRWYHTTKPPYVPYHATITTSRLPRCCFGRTKANAPAGACNSVPSSSGESALMSTTWQTTQQMAFLALQYGMIAFWLSRRSQPAYHTTLHNSMVAIVLASLLSVALHWSGVAWYSPSCSVCYFLFHSEKAHVTTTSNWSFPCAGYQIVFTYEKQPV